MKPFIALALAVNTHALLNAQPPRPEFEVASIKPNNSGGGRASLGSKGPGRFDAENMSIRTFVAEAYNVKIFEIYGAPGWLASEKYDVNAKWDEAPGKRSEDESWADALARLQTLLEDRCALKVHRETKELPIYVLTVAKSGAKLKAPNCVTFDMDNRPAPPAPGAPRPNYCGNMRTGREGAGSTMTATGIEISFLVRFLSSTTGRTVIDKTGYTEKFDATMTWTPDGPARSPAGDESPKADDTAGPSIFTALQEQLGLKLESSKGPVEVLVIDHIEKPSAN